MNNTDHVISHTDTYIEYGINPHTQRYYGHLHIKQKLKGLYPYSHYYTTTGNRFLWLVKIKIYYRRLQLKF